MASPTPEVASAVPQETRKPASKASRSSKIVKLRLPSSALKKWHHQQPTSDPSQSSLTASIDSDSTAKPSESTPQKDASDSNATPVPTPSIDGASLQPVGAKRKGIPGPKPGYKRNTNVSDADGQKSKAKPGPKKRKIDDDGNPINAAPAAASKLGPKANQGAINAGLRALDRSGKPCRRWNKSSIKLKSFNGHAWDLPYWASVRPDRSELSGEVKSDSTGSSDAKPGPESSVVNSDRGDKPLSNGHATNLDIPASSPMPGGDVPSSPVSQVTQQA